MCLRVCAFRFVVAAVIVVGIVIACGFLWGEDRSVLLDYVPVHWARVGICKDDTCGDVQTPSQGSTVTPLLGPAPHQCMPVGLRRNNTAIHFLGRVIAVTLGSIL